MTDQVALYNIIKLYDFYKKTYIYLLGTLAKYTY